MSSHTLAKKALPAIVGIGALLLAGIASVPSATASSSEGVDCITLTTGELACGRADASICAGFGEGFATGLVNWTLRVDTLNPYSTKDYDSVGAIPAFAGGGLAAMCSTSTCTWATLLANDEVVSTSIGICW